MAPMRKKSKPNAAEPSEQQSPERTQPTNGTEPGSSQSASARSSWYGSWRSKASPVAQIAKESISVARGATSESSQSSSAQRPPNSVSKSVKGGSRKSVPLVAEATAVNATGNVGDQGRQRRLQSQSSLRDVGGAGIGAGPSAGSDDASGPNDLHSSDEGKYVVEEAALPPQPGLDGEVGEPEDQRPQSGTWLWWWSRPDDYQEKERSKEQAAQEATEASNTPLPGTPQAQPADAKPNTISDNEGIKPTETVGNADPAQAFQSNSTSRRSWFGLWSSGPSRAEEQKGPGVAPEVTVSPDPPNVEEVVKHDASSKNGGKPQSADETPKSSGWAFWSADKPKPSTATPGGTQKQMGELAVADTPSQSHPEAAQFNEQPEAPKEAKAEPKRTSSLLRGKAGNSEKQKAKESSGPSTPSSETATASSAEQISQEDSEQPKPLARGKTSQAQPNHVLPTFGSNFSPAPNPGYVERFSSYLTQTFLPSALQEAPRPPHVEIVRTPYKVRKAVALGIHGFFPTQLIQKVLGQPTGTSIRFANYAASSIKTWCQEHQPEVKNVEVEKVALEGEGFIADRVTTLWKLLLNWLSHLRQADFILVACHSQGVPVALMLVAKLLQLGCLSPNVRIGVCAMAGINLGPFTEYKSRLFGGSALELFDFRAQHSKVSTVYRDALDHCLRWGVRVTFIGSLDDQLVSLESSLFTPLNHPYVARAVFIDGRFHPTPNFLTHLVVFALKLRNLGVSDHGLLRELSAPLAGSLVGGEGHSRVYDDPGPYRLAVEFALQTTDVAPPVPASSEQSERDRVRDAAAARRASLGGMPSSPALANSIRRGSISASVGSLPGIAPTFGPYAAPSSAASGSSGSGASGAANPFVLPWAVRGVLGEDLVRKDESLRKEVKELVKEFDDWQPVGKGMRDVRWRLEGVRGMMV